MRSGTVPTWAKLTLLGQSGVYLTFKRQPRYTSSVCFVKDARFACELEASYCYS